MPLFGPEEEGRQTKIGCSRPNLVIFCPFLAFEGRLGGLKYPLEVRVEDKTCFVTCESIFVCYVMLLFMNVHIILIVICMSLHYYKASLHIAIVVCTIILNLKVKLL